MPYIDDEYVDFDPEALADAIAAGKVVRPHYDNKETSFQAQQRVWDEKARLSEVLKKKHPNVWLKTFGEPSGMKRMNALPDLLDSPKRNSLSLNALPDLPKKNSLVNASSFEPEKVNFEPLPTPKSLPVSAPQLQAPVLLNSKVIKEMLEKYPWLEIK